MKERPIIFSAPMVRALLAGTKSQTRRVMRDQPYSNGFHFDGREILCHNDYLPPSATLLSVRVGRQRYTTSLEEESGTFAHLCPYGQPGDRLWVRETWNGTQGEGLAYKATEPEMDGEPWRSPIHMPRRFSRITLEITGVRVERLREITETDARAEGITDGGCTDPSPDARDAYFWLWNSLHGDGAALANPWVWVIEFRRVTP